MKILAIGSLGLAGLSLLSLVVYGVVAIFAAGYTFVGCAVSTLLISLIIFGLVILEVALGF